MQSLRWKSMCSSSTLPGVVALVLALLLVQLGGCGPSAPSSAGSHPAPKVYIKGVALVSGTNIDVCNKDTFDWQNVDLELNPGVKPGPYRCHVGIVTNMSVLTVPVAQFVNSDGQPFDLSRTKPRAIAIRCDTPEGKGLCEAEWD